MNQKDIPVFRALTPERAGALTIYGEARGEVPDGKLAVGFVILNRSHLWVHTIHDVVFHPNDFSCYLSSDPQYKKLLAIASTWPDTNIALNMCLSAFQTVLSGNVGSVVGNATFYKTLTVRNAWFDSQIKCGNLILETTIGHHEFYSEKRFRT